MTIEQTVEIPASHRVVIEFPKEIPVGKTRVAIILSPGLNDAQTSAEFGLMPEYIESLCMPKPNNGITPAEALKNLLGCRLNSGDTMDAYMERHWADNDLERAIELRREKEREQYRWRTQD
jgi:hypothetical protein